MFTNRTDAAQKLSEALAAYKNSKGIVIAIPRGGVPVGVVVAKALQLPLEIYPAKKIGHPVNREYAVASVSLNGIEYNRNQSDVDPSYIETEGKRIQEELLRRYRKFTGHAQPENVSGKIIILVDDGIATGSTLIAAVKGLRKMNPCKIVIAVPVAPPSAVVVFSEIADEYICLLEPEDFSGVGQFYQDFSEVTDEEVISILNEQRRGRTGSH